MTVEEMLSRMSSAELTWWKQLFRIKADEVESESKKSSSGSGSVGFG